MSAKLVNPRAMFALVDNDGDIISVFGSPFTCRKDWTDTWTDPAKQKWRHWYRKGYRVVPVLVKP